MSSNPRFPNVPTRQNYDPHAPARSPRIIEGPGHVPNPAIPHPVALFDAPLIRAKPLVQNKAGSVTQLSALFPYQSYCSTSLLQNALLSQPPGGQGLVSLQTTGQQLAGKSIALMPGSECPVAIKFNSDKQSAGPAIILTPGQWISPSGGFQGFNWGLPFGWLGGGVATILVFQDEAATTKFGEGVSEVMFHQFTYAVQQTVPVSPTADWPTRFPWPRAQVITNSLNVSQAGQPIIQVAEPTRVMMRLRVANLAAPASCQLIWRGMTSWDVGSDGMTPVNTTKSYADITWGSDSSGLGAFPVQELPGDFLRMMADGTSAVAAGLDIVDTSGGSLLGAYIDIQRWGRIG